MSAIATGFIVYTVTGYGKTLLHLISWIIYECSTALFATPYGNSRKIPDLCIVPDNQYQPSFVVEIGWTESHRRLTDDMRLWMVGGRPYVKIVLVVKFARRGRTSKVTGKVGLYVPDSAGNPVLQQEA
ncbi:hypothetical protein KXV73_004588, partial [Aspergillus fumigatus]